MNKDEPLAIVRGSTNVAVTSRRWLTSYSMTSRSFMFNTDLPYIGIDMTIVRRILASTLMSESTILLQKQSDTVDSDVAGIVGEAIGKAIRQVCTQRRIYELGR
jgi:hypothetical protein